MKLDSSNSLTYDFPSQLDPTDTTQAQNFNIRVNSGGTNYDVPATYSISGQKLTVTIDTNSSNYTYLSNAQNVEIQLNIAAVFNSNNDSEEIDFGNNLKKDVTVNSNATLDVDKQLSKYDEATGKFHYTVTVKSNGYSKNVVVTDSITGTALIYDDNSLSVTSSTDRTVTSTSTDTQTNGFKYTVDHISNNEILTFTYTASVDYSKLSGDNFTADETKNTITAKGDNNNEQQTKENSTTQKAVTLFTKSGTAGEVSNNQQTATWTITVNPNCKVNKGGTVIKDTLTSTDKAPTKYSGDGFTLKTYDASGNQVGDATSVTWASLNVTESSTSFEYTLPTNDTSIPYKYVIEYTTTTDNSSVITNNTSITNTVSNNNDSEYANANVTITKGDDFTVSKTHNANTLTKDNVDYTVTVAIPKSGFSSSFVVEDTLPGTWANSTYQYDSYIANSLAVKLGDTTLAENTDYTLTTTEGSSNNPVKLTITFSSTGINKLASTENRNLVLTYKTNPADTWDDNGTH